ncbi:MAG: hypothetical protein PWQ77_156 [Kosmotogales bacterium]|nr:hypothetical protein [Kosmotogales bacterium]
MKCFFIFILVLFSVFLFGNTSFKGEISFLYYEGSQSFPFKVEIDENETGMIKVPATIEFRNSFSFYFSTIIQADKIIFLWENDKSDEFIYLYGDISKEKIELDGIHNYKGKRTSLKSFLNGPGEKIASNENVENETLCDGIFENYGNSFENDPFTFKYRGKLYFFEKFNSVSGFIKRPDNGQEFKQDYFGLINDKNVILSYINSGDGSEWINLFGEIKENKIILEGSHYFGQNESAVKMDLNLNEINKKDRIKNWTEDLKFLKEELPKNHKNLFFNITKEKFNESMDEIIHNISNLNDYQIIYSLKEIFAQIGDSHTDFISPLPDIVYPVETYWFDDGIYIINSTKSNCVKKKISKLDGTDIEIISNKMKKFYPCVNVASELLFTPQLISDPWIYKFIYNKNSLKVESEANIFEMDYLPKNIYDLKNKFPIEMSKTPLYLTYRESPFWSNYNEDERILYCQYNICWNDKNSFLYPDADFNAFEKNLINIVKENKIDKFIFDLRFNMGGNSSTGTELIKKISKYKENIGKSFVIIGRNTFSSAILNAYDVLEYLDAVSVGEATWGQPNSYGEIKYLTLPNSGISVSYSTKFFKETDQKVNSLIPEIPVKLSFDDYIAGKDPSLEAIKDYE